MVDLLATDYIKEIGQKYMVEGTPLSEPAVKIWDSRSDDVYRYQSASGEVFKLGDHDYVVLYAYPRFQPSSDFRLPSCAYEILHELESVAFNQLDGHGFVALDPLTTSFRKTADYNSYSWDVSDGSALSYFDIGCSTLRTQYELRESHISYEQWMIGACIDKLLQPQSGGWWVFRTSALWSYEHLLSQLDHIHCLSVWGGEWHDSLFITTPFDGINGFLSSLREFTGA